MLISITIAESIIEHAIAVFFLIEENSDMHLKEIEENRAWNCKVGYKIWLCISYMPVHIYILF